MHLRDILTPNRVTLSLPATSKKRLLESVSQLLGQDDAGLDAQAAFQCLTERERLGSTGIGEGVALPHGRMKGLGRAIGAFALLETEMDYDAIDRKPVRMVFALLVPEHATTEHLQLLSQIAAVFNNRPLREKLLQAKSREDLYNALVGSSPA
jgi:PTS system nitrogen regulatory IIA component